MNETMKTLMERRSCRSYKSDPVPEEILNQILEAGTFAATGMGKQSPIMIAVTNKKSTRPAFQNECGRDGRTEPGRRRRSAFLQ